MDEDARHHDELREKYSLQERRLCLTQAEMEELRGGLEASERARKLIEQELVDTTERFSEISMQVCIEIRHTDTQHSYRSLEVCHLP